MRAYIYILVVFYLINSCSEEKDFHIVSKGDITESVYASGIIESYNQYQVFPTINGIIKDILIDEGDIVSIGTPLVLITNNNTESNNKNAEIIAHYNDFNNQKSKLKEVELNIQLAKDKLKVDSLNFERQKKLFNKDIIAKSDFEIQELNYNNSIINYKSLLLKYDDLKNQLKTNDNQSKNNLRLTELLKKELIIKSEIEGKIYSVLKNKGELVSPQNPLIIIGSEKEFKIILQVDEFDIIKIKENQKVIVSLDSYKKEVFNALITKINPIMNERSKTFSIEAKFTKKPKTLYPNLTLEGNILLNEKSNVITIPREYIVEDSFVLDKNGNKIEVKLGLKDYQKAEVLTGLSENEKIYLPEE